MQKAIKHSLHDSLQKKLLVWRKPIAISSIKYKFTLVIQSMQVQKDKKVSLVQLNSKVQGEQLNNRE